MTKPTPSLEPQKPALLGEYFVTNWMPYIPRDTSAGFEFTCKETPLRAIWTTTAIITSVFLGFFILLWIKAPHNLWIVPLIGLPTILGFHFGMIYYHRHEQRRGPILRYGATQRRFEFPRARVTLTFQEIDHFALTCGWDTHGDWLCQLQAIPLEGPPILIITAYTQGELEPMAQKLRSVTPTPVKTFIMTSSRKNLWQAQEPATNQ